MLRSAILPPLAVTTAWTPWELTGADALRDRGRERQAVGETLTADFVAPTVTGDVLSLAPGMPGALNRAGDRAVPRGGDRDLSALYGADPAL
jgi:hypothetical protein